MTKPDLKNLTLPELVEFVESLGLSAYRGRQIFAWLYKPGITEFRQMTDLSLKVRELLDGKAYFSSLTPEVVEKSADGTKKYGFRLSDGAMIESVLIPDQGRNTLCVSSQVGCAMGCRFCLTGTMGLKRNLAPAEIVNQIGGILNDVIDKDHDPKEPITKYISNLVFMGMGEPLANFENLIKSIHILTEQRGYNFSERRITVSTCGLVPRIRELGEQTNVNLAISLHAVDDETRSKLMPVNITYNIDDLLEACRKFPLAKRRRIMFEYILLKDINDSTEHARILAKKLRNIRCKINLLPCNLSDALPFEKPSEETINAFQEVLRHAGYTVLVRTSRGADIDAACGQLAAKH